MGALGAAAQLQVFDRIFRTVEHPQRVQFETNMDERVDVNVQGDVGCFAANTAAARWRSIYPEAEAKKETGSGAGEKALMWVRIASALGLAMIMSGCGKSAEVIRIDTENLARADEFKRRIERDNPVGTPILRVGEYVRAQGFTFGNLSAFTHDGVVTYSGAIYVLMFTEDSPRSGGDEAAVGVVLLFKDARFARAYPQSWDAPDSCWWK